MQTVRKAIGAVLAAAAFALGGGSALADTCCTGFYLEAVVIGGGGFVKDIKSTGRTNGNLKDDSAQDSVAGGGIALGFNWKRLGAPIRTELEFHRMVRLDWDSRPVFTNVNTSAGMENNLDSTAIMLNVLYDFEIGYSWWRPYAGFGIGYAQNHSDVNYNDFNVGGANTVRSESFNTSNLAWSVMAGANFDITPNWYAQAAYRFINIGDAEAGYTPAGVKLESDTVYRHELRLGFGYRF